MGAIEVLTEEAHPMRDLEFGWFLPTRGDTDDYGDPLKIAAGLEMFDRVAIAADEAGFEYMLVPVGRQCWDAWMTGAMMIGRTKSIRMLVAARPSYINPVLLAKMIATFDQLCRRAHLRQPDRRPERGREHRRGHALEQGAALRDHGRGGRDP